MAVRFVRCVRSRMAVRFVRCVRSGMAVCFGRCLESGKAAGIRKFGGDSRAAGYGRNAESSGKIGDKGAVGGSSTVCQKQGPGGIFGENVTGGDQGDTRCGVRQKAVVGGRGGITEGFIP